MRSGRMTAVDPIFELSVRLNHVQEQVARLHAQVMHLQMTRAPAGGVRETSEEPVAEAGTEKGGDETSAVAGRGTTGTAAADVRVDSRACIGCGLCARIAPGTFVMQSQTGRAAVVDEPRDAAATIRMAMTRCPTGAIRVQ